MIKARNTAEYLTDLTKWQARNPGELANCNPKELFQGPFVKRYRILHFHLLRRVCRLHGILLTLNQLAKFPFEFIYGEDKMEFWRLVLENSADVAILLLCGLAKDPGKNAHSLESFRDEIIKEEWLRPEMLRLFKQTLRERNFDKTARTVADRVQRIRNNVVAHQLKDNDNACPTDVSLEELWTLFDSIHSLFGALSFGSAYITLAGDLTPSTVRGEPTRTCLDGVLDAVLRDSSIVNEPERKAKWWPNRRKHRSAERLQILNELRKKIGLPEA